MAKEEESGRCEDDAIAGLLPCLGIGDDDRVGNQGLAEWFDSQNDSEAWQQLLASRAQYDVISFSHFLPSQVGCCGSWCA